MYQNVLKGIRRYQSVLQKLRNAYILKLIRFSVVEKYLSHNQFCKLNILLEGHILQFQSINFNQLININFLFIYFKVI